MTDPRGGHRGRRPARFSRVALANGAGAIAALALAMVAATLGGGPSAGPATPVSTDGGAAQAIPRVRLPDGREAIADAAGVPVPIAPYARIVSASTTADWILAELVATTRVAAFTERGAANAPWRHKLAGRPTLRASAELESVLALEPDLVLVESLGDPRRLARLREHGLAVFDLGQSRGVATLVPTIAAVGALVGNPDGAQALAARFRRSLAGIAAGVPARGRPAAVYVSAYGGSLYGGARGTSYHDVITYAGLRDAAAARYEGWPVYDAEALLALDPDVVVTRAGAGAALCAAPGLDRLRACQRAGGVVEIDGFALDDPGPGIRDAAEALHRAVYGSRTLAP